MAKNGYRVMDSDMHIVEPADLWQRYIDLSSRPRARGHQPAPAGPGSAGRQARIPSAQPELLQRHTTPDDQPANVYADSEQQEWDAASQVAAMDNEGIEMAVLFPSRGLFTLGDSDLEPPLATAISRAYNDWLADFCSGSPDRLFGAAMIPPQDIEGAVAEARRSVNELGFRTCLSAEPGVRPQLARPILRPALGRDTGSGRP